MIDISKEPTKKTAPAPIGKILVYTATFSLGWLFIWFSPWQFWFSTSIWLKVGISLVIFIIPGAMLYGLLSNENQSFLNTISFGFVISHFLIAMLGTIGRFAHIPFGFVKHSFMFTGIIFSLLFFQTRLGKSNLQRLKNSSLLQIFRRWPLIVTIILTVLMSIQRIVTSDDFTYLALLNKFQHLPSLTYNDIFLGTANTISPRFWILSTPFSQAFLADLSRLHGIYWIGGFYEPFLIIISILSLYSLARFLGLSKQAAAASVAFQIVFLALLSNYLSPGFPFFSQLSTDKATASFILFPVFLQSVIKLLESPTSKKFFLCLLVGMSMSLMHALTLAFTLVVIGFIGIFRFSSSPIKSYIPLILIILIILIPQIFVRFANPDTQGTIAYAIKNANTSSGKGNLFSVLGNTMFYGFNPSILAMAVPYESLIPFPKSILEWGWILIPVVSMVFTIKHLKRNKLAQFVCAGFLLVSLAGIPFTGWILGYFVSPRMLARTTWLYPYGISTVFFLISVRDRTHLGKQISKWTQTLQNKHRVNFSKVPKLLITTFSTGILLLVMRYQNLPNFDRLNTNTQRYQEFAHIGQFLDDRIEDRAIVIGTNSINDYIPGLAGKAYVINFRDSKPLYTYFYTEEERKEFLSDQDLILSNSVLPEVRLSLIKKYDIQYILIKGGERHIVNNLISTYPSRFNLIKIDRYLILEVLDNRT